MIDLTLFIYPILAALALSLVAGPIGCFVNWRRMAFYSDTLSHASLLGIALGLLAGIGAVWGVLAVSVTASLLLLWLQRRPQVAPDALLAILAQASLAGGILILYLKPSLNVNLYGFLFGDVLAIGQADALIITGCGALVLALLVTQWRSLLLVTLHEELAQAEGIRVGAIHALLMLLMALTVAAGIYVSGVMMVSSLLIIPSASARAFARTPSGMAAWAAALGFAATTAGLLAAFRLDVPPGPAIVLAAALIFVISTAWSRLRPATR